MTDEVPAWEQLRARLNAPGFRTARGEVRWVDEDGDGQSRQGWCRFVRAPADRWFVEDEQGVQFVRNGDLVHVRNSEGVLVRSYGGSPASSRPESWSVLTGHLDPGPDAFLSPTDFFRAAGPATPVRIAGRRAWEVTVLPPPHKEFPLVVAVDDLTGTVLREASGDGGWAIEFLDFQPHVEVDYTLFHWSGPFQEAPRDEEISRPRVGVAVPTEEDRRRMRARLTVLDGLADALARRDEVLSLVANASTVDRARAAVADLLGIDEHTATAVLDTQLRRLPESERQKVFDERAELVEFLGRA